MNEEAIEATMHACGAVISKVIDEAVSELRDDLHTAVSRLDDRCNRLEDTLTYVKKKHDSMIDRAAQLLSEEVAALRRAFDERTEHLA